MATTGAIIGAVIGILLFLGAVYLLATGVIDIYNSAIGQQPLGVWAIIYVIVGFIFIGAAFGSIFLLGAIGSQV